jgi:glycerol uptake facilitator protein
MLKSFIGELLGTSIIVLVGLSSIAISITTDYLQGVFQVPLVWGVGVCLAIYISGQLCSANLNPAVSFYFFLRKALRLRDMLLYWIAQSLGALFGAFVVYLLFNEQLDDFEQMNQLERGMFSGIKTGMVYSEYYPNPNVVDYVPMWKAMIFEGLGFMVLILGIQFIIDKLDRFAKWHPVLIGLLLAVIIQFVAPYTMCGINPARDLMPRIVAYFAGYDAIAFSKFGTIDYLYIYTISPLLGACLSHHLYRLFLKR